MMSRLFLVLTLFAAGSGFAVEKPRDSGTHFFNDSFWDFSEELQTHVNPARRAS